MFSILEEGNKREEIHLSLAGCCSPSSRVKEVKAIVQQYLQRAEGNKKMIMMNCCILNSLLLGSRLSQAIFWNEQCFYNQNSVQIFRGEKK